MLTAGVYVCVFDTAAQVREINPYSSAVGEEKENRMVEMLITSTSSLSIMLGKVLGLGAAGLLQISIWVLAAIIAVPRISDQFSGLSELSLTRRGQEVGSTPYEMPVLCGLGDLWKSAEIRQLGTKDS